MARVRSVRQRRRVWQAGSQRQSASAFSQPALRSSVTTRDPAAGRARALDRQRLAAERPCRRTSGRATGRGTPCSRRRGRAARPRAAAGGCRDRAVRVGTAAQQADRHVVVARQDRATEVDPAARRVDDRALRQAVAQREALLGRLHARDAHARRARERHAAALAARGGARRHAHARADDRRPRRDRVGRRDGLAGQRRDPLERETAPGRRSSRRRSRARARRRSPR